MNYDGHAVRLLECSGNPVRFGTAERGNLESSIDGDRRGVEMEELKAKAKSKPRREEEGGIGPVRVRRTGWLGGGWVGDEGLGARSF